MALRSLDRPVYVLVVFVVSTQSFFKEGKSSSQSYTCTLAECIAYEAGYVPFDWQPTFSDTFKYVLCHHARERGDR